MAQSGSTHKVPKERQSPEDRRALERRLARLRRHEERREKGAPGSAGPAETDRRDAERRHVLERRLAYNRRRSRGRRAGYDREGGLKRLGIDQQTAAALAEFHPVLTKHMDRILSDFRSRSKVAAAGGAKSLGGLKRRWLNDILGGNFTGPEMRRRTKAKQPAIDLESPWTIPCYSFVLGRVLDLVATTYARKPKKIKTVQDAVTKAVFLDMDMAVFNYTQSVEETSEWIDTLSAEEIAVLMDDNG